MRSTVMIAVSCLSLVGAAALALAPRDADRREVSEDRVRAHTEARLAEVFRGLLAAEQVAAAGPVSSSR